MVNSSPSASEQGAEGGADRRVPAGGEVSGGGVGCAKLGMVTHIHWWCWLNCCDRKKGVDGVRWWCSVAVRHREVITGDARLDAGVREHQGDVVSAIRGSVEPEGLCENLTTCKLRSGGNGAWPTVLC